MPAWRPQEDRTAYPVPPKPLQAEHQPRSKRGGSLHRASFLRQAQVVAEQTPLRQLAVEERTSHTKILAEQSLPEQALEGRTSQEENPPKHPPARHRQLDLEQLEHMMLKIEALEKVVRKLAGRRLPPTLATELAEDHCNQSSVNNNNNNNNNTTNKQQQPQQQQ